MQAQCKHDACMTCAELDGEPRCKDPEAIPRLWNGARCSGLDLRMSHGSRTFARTWLAKLYEKLSREQRSELARIAAEEGLEVSVKYIKADGTQGVPRPQRPHPMFWLLTMRHGGKDLRGTQVYPDGYGVAIADHHINLMAWSII